MRALIVATDLDNCIGKNNEVPWNIPADLKIFKEKTLNATVVMGRKTFESLPVKPLRHRTNVVLTTDKDYDTESGKIKVLHSLEDVLKIPDFVVIGGAEIYKLLEPYCTIAYISKMPFKVQGDTFFKLSEDWELVTCEFIKDEKTSIEFSFEMYSRSLMP